MQTTPQTTPATNKKHVSLTVSTRYIRRFGGFHEKYWIDHDKQHVLGRIRSRGKEAVVWLHTLSRREWAILHTATKNKCEISEVAILEVNVPRTKLRRRWRGLWSTPETLKTFVSIQEAAAFAGSPIA